MCPFTALLSSALFAGAPPSLEAPSGGTSSQLTGARHTPAPMSLAALPMLAVLGVLPGLLLKFLSRGLGHWRWVDARCSATPGLPSLPTTTSKTKTASTVLRDSPTPVPLNVRNQMLGVTSSRTTVSKRCDRNQKTRSSLC